VFSTWKPSTKVAVVNESVCLPLMVNGRMPKLSGPMRVVTVSEAVLPAAR
jgi:hypothetical protein